MEGHEPESADGLVGQVEVDQLADQKKSCQPTKKTFLISERACTVLIG